MHRQVLEAFTRLCGAAHLKCGDDCDSLDVCAGGSVSFWADPAKTGQRHCFKPLLCLFLDFTPSFDKLVNTTAFICMFELQDKNFFFCSLIKYWAWGSLLLEDGKGCPTMIAKPISTELVASSASKSIGFSSEVKIVEDLDWFLEE